MRRKNARKGFTIVELVIVIAVIAILATTLVPTFGNVIQNAQETAAKQEAKNAYTSYMVANAGKGEMPELFLYKAEEGRVVAIRNGAAVGIYATPEEALKAMVGEDALYYQQDEVAKGLFALTYDESVIALTYDDRYDVSGKTVEIINPGTPTSYKVGVGVAPGTLDDAVITQDGDKLIATGIGAAQVKIDGTLHQIKVTPAPISLFMITGHSMGQGAYGDATKSVVGADGQVYSSYGTNNLSASTEGVGISYAALNQAANINAFTEAGSGTVGEGSALAWQWNNLTGEKVWVLNTAVGGSWLEQWIPNKTNYMNAVAQFQRAQVILSNEINAGHYTLNSMGIFYHNGANPGAFTQDDLCDWYDAMWSGFKQELSRDMNGDGQAETVSFLGLVPFWRMVDGYSFGRDEPAGLYMAASAEYPDIFTVSMIGQDWLTNESVTAKFPEITYRIQNGTSLARPTKTDQVFVSDKVHYQQVGYNAVGIDIANNLFTWLKGKTAAPEITILGNDGKTELPDSVELSYGESMVLVSLTEPITAGGVTFTVSGCIELSYPLQISATGNGTGTLTVSYNGTILKQITFVCNDAPVSSLLTDWSGASAVFVGDSITYASGIANPYHKLVEAELGLLNSPHMGIAGSCISATSNYGNSNTPLINRYQNIPDADLIVIFMGTNDFGHNTPLGTDQDTTDISFYGALNMIIPGVKAAHPNSQIVVMTPLHRGAFNGQPVDSAQNGAGCTLADYVGAIKDVCADNEIPVIDLFNLCALNPTDKIYFSDNLHPTAKGHEELAKIIAEELKKIPCVRKSGSIDDGNEVPVEPTPEELDYALEHGNRFANMPDTERASTVNNIYLEAGTVIMLKDEAKFDWAVSKEINDSASTSGYYFTEQWDAAAYRIVTESGYYGFTLKKQDNTTFDFDGADSKDLRDYFEIVDTLKMVQGNRMTAGSEANRQSSAFNLYLRKGTVIKFNGANGANEWALSKVLGNTSAIKAEYVTGGWTSTATYVVAEDGYYGFVVKFNADTPVSDEYTLLDYFTISSFEISKMVQGNRMVSNVASEDGKIPMRVTSAYNLYLTAGTKITFNPGNGASHWTLSIKLDAADTIGGGNYLLDPLWSQSTSYTVQEDGYYAFVIKNNDAEINAEDYNLFDIFTIDGYNK